MSLPFEPTSVAVIGASTDEQKIGYLITQNLLTQGYGGNVFPVNPKHDEILGAKAYPSIGEIPEAVDMALIVTPASTVTKLAKECGMKKVKTLVVISAGFGETGTKEGRKAEEELRSIANEHGMHLIGPNCLGVLRPSIGLNASFAVDLPAAGSIALFSQSGALAVALMDGSPALGLGYSLVVSMGNKTQRNECDFLEMAENDPVTTVIGLYLENIVDAARFRNIARRVTRKKPIVLIKSGVSLRGGKAVSSHTGALAGSDAAIDALCAQTGIRRARSSEAFLAMLRVLSMEPPLLTNRIAVITNAGGPGILATDAAERSGLTLATLEPKTSAALKKLLPAAAATGNPVDILGDAGEERYKTAFALCANDPNVDGIVTILTPQVMTPSGAVASALVQVSKEYPLISFTTSFMGGEHVRDAVDTLHQGGVPNFPSPEEAVSALASLRPPDMPSTKPATQDESLDDRSSTARDILKNAEGLLDELTLQDLFALYGLPVPEQGIASTPEEAVELAEEIGYPVIAKISSPDLLHKTDVGGVAADLRSKSDVTRAFADIMKNVEKNAPEAGLNGILIQKMLPIGNEFIVGAVRDPSFGPLIMTGLGGIYTELTRDTSFRLAPLSSEDAYEMLTELKAWKLLLGMRGKKQLNIDALANVVSTIAALMVDCPQIVEIDCNPVLVNEKGCTVADAKVVVEKKERKFRT